MTRKTKDLREFGILIGFAFPIILGWLIPSIWGHNFRVWTLFVSFPFLFFAIFNPRLLYFFYKVWITFGNILGFINSRIIFGLVFVLVLNPIAIIMKLSGYDPLKKKFNESISYKEDKRNHIIDINRIF